MTLQELRILFVEDSPFDAELETRELRKGGLAFTSLRVETADEIRKGLAEFRPDVIICDYSLPQMDGLSVLRIARQLAPEVPFIFVSGTIGEQRAVNCLKEGATDYILKDHLDRLSHAVQRALKEQRERLERRRLEEQFRQAQKMEAVGTLAGGIAHDFNNLLCIINGYSEMALRWPGVPNEARTNLEEVLEAGQRAAALTRQLLAFSRRQVMNPVVLNVNTVVSQMSTMLGRLLGEDIELELRLAPDLGNVRADRGQMEQVLMNLAVNSRDAMPHGGRLTVETANLEAGDGRFVRVSVADTGHGIDAETQRRLFEPFFTTKPQGQGTGLGLCTVYGIVKQSGGDITVRSEVGQGATFDIRLPRVYEPVADRRARPLPATARGTETLLVAEDSKPLRSLIGDILRERGFTVIAAEGGREAIREAGAHAGPIHLLVTDVVMREIGGRELAHRLTLARPGLRVLYISGSEDRLGTGDLPPGTRFLVKPFTPDDLILKVREALDTPL